jgi:predicted ArsR family transcriptional regulator
MGTALPLANFEFPLGHKGQRGTVLVELKRAQPLTAKELATRLGVSLNAARHHLKELEAEGLVRYDRSHRGVGAPAFSYRLSPAGEGLLGGTLTEHNCAILAVAERFPEICAAEARFLSEALGAEVERRAHILSGCAACEYHVRFKTS